MRSRFFLTYRFASKNDKPYSATFGQISSKANEAFSNYAQKTSFFTLIPYNPRIKIFFQKKQKCHFLHIIKLQLCAKNQNNPMSSFRDLYRTNGRTDGRTYEQTNERRLNHTSQPRCGGPKSVVVDPQLCYWSKTLCYPSLKAILGENI